MWNRFEQSDPPKTDKKNGTAYDDVNGVEGGDDSLINSSPTDSRSDEKVVVNEQRANKTVNAPPQTAANTSQGSSYDEEILE